MSHLLVLEPLQAHPTHGDGFIENRQVQTFQVPVEKRDVPATISTSLTTCSCVRLRERVREKFVCVCACVSERGGVKGIE